MAELLDPALPSCNSRRHGALPHCWAMFDYACQQTKALHMGIKPLSSTMLDECVLCIYQKRPIHIRTALQLIPDLRQYEGTFKIHINDDWLYRSVCTEEYGRTRTIENFRKIRRSYALVFSLTHACATDGNTKRPTSGYQRNGPWFRARSDGRTRVEAIYKIDAVYLTTPDSVSVVHVLIWFGAGVRFERGYFLLVCVL